MVFHDDSLKRMCGRILHVSFTVEAARPRLYPHIPAIRESVAGMLGIPASCVAVPPTI